MRSLPNELLVLVVLALANAVLSAVETATVSARRSKLRPLSRKSSAAARALALVEQPTRLLALVQFWLTLTAVVAGVVAGADLTHRLASVLARLPDLGSSALPLAAVMVALSLTAFLILFGELIPKRIALAHPERVIVVTARLLRLPTAIAAPLLTVLEGITNLAAAALRLRPRPATESVGEEDLRALIERGLHAGVFQRAEKEMVEGVLALDRLRVTALMTPRPKIVFLNVDDPEDTNWRKIVTSGHSYFPVFQGNRDQVLGFVAVKALWAHSAIGLPTALKNLLVPALLVPETMTAIQLLDRFRKTGRHVAIVTDEFGAVQGLATLIDVLRAIVGDLPEAGRVGHPQPKRREDGSWLIDATLPIQELRSLLGLDAELPGERDAEFQTVAGFLVTQFGRIPAEGDSFDWNGWHFEVAAMDRRRVDKVLIAKAASAPPVAR